MKRVLACALILSIGVGPLPVGAEAPPRDLSVYHVNLAVDGTIIGITALGAALPVLYEPRIIKKQCPCDSGEVNAFDRPVIQYHSQAAANISNITVVLALVTPPVLDAVDVGWNKTFMEDFVVYAEVLSVDSSVSNLVRYTAQRPRPDAYRISPAPSPAGDFASFYSGHTASTFAGLSAAAMTYNLRYGPSVWPWVITAGVGTMEAAGRVVSGRHFYSDVGVGAAAGTAIGIIIPLLHKRNKASRVSIAPRITGDSAELVFGTTF
jgi:membrane-associated phospholipid phosphatase